MKFILKNLTHFLVAASALSSIPAQANFGAIAFDQNSYAYGFRVGSATAADAQAGALYWCRSGGSTQCAILWTFENACGTLAVSQNRRNWWNVHNQGTLADQVAFTQSESVRNCVAAGGERCAPQVSMCSDQDSGYAFNGQNRVSAAVAQFGATQIGQMIGSGQCWDLVDQALLAAGAVRPGARNFDTYVFGQEVYNNFQVGDVIQFENVRLQSPHSYQELPHHTAIVAAANGSIVTVYHQNVNGDMHVQTGVFDLATKVRGLIRVYRPVPNE